MAYLYKFYINTISNLESLGKCKSNNIRPFFGSKDDLLLYERNQNKMLRQFVSLQKESK